MVALNASFGEKPLISGAMDTFGNKNKCGTERSEDTNSVI
jgi:hypothetical protein